MVVQEQPLCWHHCHSGLAGIINCCCHHLVPSAVSTQIRIGLYRSAIQPFNLARSPLLLIQEFLIRMPFFLLPLPLIPSATASALPFDSALARFSNPFLASVDCEALFPATFTESSLCRSSFFVAAPLLLFFFSRPSFPLSPSFSAMNNEFFRNEGCLPLFGPIFFPRMISFCSARSFQVFQPPSFNSACFLTPRTPLI